MSALVICGRCGAPCTDTGARTCDCEPAPAPARSRLGEVALTAALDDDRDFRRAVRRAAWFARTPRGQA